LTLAPELNGYERAALYRTRAAHIRELKLGAPSERAQARLEQVAQFYERLAARVGGVSLDTPLTPTPNTSASAPHDLLIDRREGAPEGQRCRLR
jgi:hypothetical protein